MSATKFGEWEELWGRVFERADRRVKLLGLDLVTQRVLAQDVKRLRPKPYLADKTMVASWLQGAEEVR